MQPYFLPYGGYFSLLHSSDIFVFLDGDQFVRRRWLNRVLIQTPTGVNWLTLPVAAHHQKTPINQIVVSMDGRERTKLRVKLRTVFENNQLLNFHAVEEILENSGNLAQININLIRAIAQKLELSETTFVLESETAVDRGSNYQDRAVNLCRLFGADVYLNASGGVNLYEKERFEEAGLSLAMMVDYVSTAQDKLSVISNATPLANLANSIKLKSEYRLK